LLQAPFCVHPKTGKVCVPIDPAAAWDFDPEEVPTVQQLVQQLSEQQQQQAAAGGGAPDAPGSKVSCVVFMHNTHCDSLSVACTCDGSRGQDVANGSC
jgi:DNA primase small subunit